MSLSLLTALVLCEILIRILYGNPTIWKEPQMAFVYNSSCGYKMKPNQNTFTANAKVTTNRFGFRDIEWVVPKPKDTFRVMVLGDSFTFGQNVEEKYTFVKRLNGLFSSTNKHIQFMNFGVSGWSLQNHLDYLKTECLNFEPDLVIYSFFDNDMQCYRSSHDNSITFDENGRIDVRPYWLKWLPYRYIFILKRSALFTFLRLKLNFLVSKIDKNDLNRCYRELLLVNYYNLPEMKWFKDFLTQLRELKEIFQTRKTELVMVEIPSYAYFQIAGRDVQYLELIESYCNKRNIYFLPLSKLFKKSKIEKYYMGPWDYHLSPFGHLRVAQACSEFLFKKNLLPLNDQRN